MMSELLYSNDIAARLGWAIQTFRNRKRELVEKFELPKPAALPGRERWLAADIDAWLASRSQGKAAEPAVESAEAAPVPMAKAAAPAASSRASAAVAPVKKGKGGRKRNPMPVGGRA